jgi:sodium-coupled neutral amino acid transporter 11
MALACAMTHYSIILLVRVGIELGASTYEQACFAGLGRAGYVLVCGCLLVFDFGACLSYLVIMTDAAARALAQLAPSLGPHDGPLREWALLACAPLLLLLCLKRDLSKLERWSAFSVALCVLLALFVCWQYVALDGSLAEPAASTPLPLARAGIASAFGTVAFAFVNNDTALLLYATLRKPSERRWAALSAGSLATALCICASFAALGFMTFRENVSDNLLNDYPSSGAPILAMRLAYALSMLLTYPTTFFVVRHVCNELLYAGSDGHAPVQQNPRARHVVLTLAIFALSFGLAAARVTLGVVMGLTGGFAGVVIAFVLPPALWLKCNPSGHSLLLWRNRGAVLASARELGPAIAMLAFGVCAAVLAPAQTAACELAAERFPSIC